MKSTSVMNLNIKLDDRNNIKAVNILAYILQRNIAHIVALDS